MTKTAIKPHKLEKGATIGIVSPASPVLPAELEAGVKYLEDLGYQVVFGKYSLCWRGHLAGTDQQRAEDLMDMFQRKDVHAVMCSRGGFGAARIVEYLDPQVFRDNPKLFIGFSDVTVIHLWLQRHVGLASLYGPNLRTFSGKDASHYAFDVFKRFISDPQFCGRLPCGAAPRRPIVRGLAEGYLTGGCATVVSLSIGTPYEVITDEAILFLEDDDAPPWHFDDVVTQLRLSGKLSACKGIVFGTLTKWQDHVKDMLQLSPEEILDDHLTKLPSVPSFSYFPFGHISEPLPIPYGLRARMNADEGTLEVLEPLTV